MKDLTKFISVTYRRTQVFLTDHLKDLEVSSGQFMYIVAICEIPGQSQDELAERLLIDKSTAAKVIYQLECSNFISRKINSQDKRVFNIYPTDKAQSVYPQILKIKEDWHNKITTGLSKTTVEELEELLEKLMQNAITYYKQ